VAENTEVRELWRDALSGRISRRDVMRRGLALGLSAPVLAALAQESIRGALAAEEGKPSTTFYSWMLQYHPAIVTIGKENGYNVETAPTTNFGNDRFIAEAKQQKSTWDFYGGCTPFLEMLQLISTDTIEPWDPYMPAGMLDDFAPPTRAEGSVDGKLYVWPLLLDICVQASHAGIVAKAGLDPETPPKDWDEFIANAQKVQDSGAAPYGLTFDNRDWRSLIPITHSISTDVYTPDGLFMWTSDPAVQALETMKRMMPLANPDVLASASVDNNAALSDEQVFTKEQAAYYFKYQNAPLRCASVWSDPTQLHLAALPITQGGVGGTVFWDTGAVLFKYGFNKPQAANLMAALSKDQRIWKNSLVGDKSQGTNPVGQLPILQSIWNEWATNPPDYVQANPWAAQVWESLPKATAIAPSVLSIKQFDIARPLWHQYLSGEVGDAKTALKNADDAVRKEFKTETGKDAQ
jgi:multiple sugar transport system substrate-binding protein